MKFMKDSNGLKLMMLGHVENENQGKSFLAFLGKHVFNNFSWTELLEGDERALAWLELRGKIEKKSEWNEARNWQEN